MKTLLFINLRSHKVERIAPVIEAKRQGYRVVLMTDHDPQLIDSGLDEVIEIDTYDETAVVEAVIAYHQQHHLSGILTWSDKDVELVAQLNDRLQLPGIPVSHVKNARNKYLMRMAFDQVPDISPDYENVRSEVDLRHAVARIGTPGILKPVGASGSKGIFKIESEECIEYVYETLRHATSPERDKVYHYYPNDYIYEGYLVGEEVSVEGVVQNGEVRIAGITDKAVTPEYSLEYIAIFPSDKNAALQQEIKTKATQAIQSLGIDHCAFHLEGRVTKDGFKVIESAARPGGGFIASHLIPSASGHSYIEKILDVAVGNDVTENWPTFDQTSKKMCFYSVMAEQAGIFKGVQGLDRLVEIPGVHYVVSLKNYGDSVILPPEHFSSCFVLNIVFEAESTEAVQQKIDWIHEVIEVIVE
ncbi:TPA: ATP-grasp domain-containing protein [Staphylococcus pseudintermedius]|uniref:ATP-grasp domain-containing protein n=1 Tax=Staphylococcus pseudintermedius TaxID=283734 RepID=UPI0018F56D48|nr:ATP-grasp domain-containing protein [Staphylococcus pseudintermedius]EGQ4286968.1 ATP-grasp domain-containing protein [Staphylococcus pseudintermedius]EHS7155795.1 ATP-grasp domain-containing protein [Staphylococcus pseudintermedius]EHS7181736.1 ATP-grasp domain-containing protein [Staphylococcus pseudintermedius]EHS7211930.1 ATP-grasp domain-containing protein [Staphylococcus pseudintermedius]MBJ8253295.1 ATP-grasp domain-containing protein [Staphylococcus pseudintermedius]